MTGHNPRQDFGPGRTGQGYYAYDEAGRLVYYAQPYPQPQVQPSQPRFAGSGYQQAPFPQPAPAVQRDPGPGLTLWSCLIVVVAFLIASVVWLGVSTSTYPTLTAEQRQEREGVQTPGESDPNAQGGHEVLVPEFALWAPGTKIQSTDHYPQPGESFTAQSCTVALSFSSEDGRNFAVTAGHCGKEGDLVWPTYAETVQDYSVEVGRYIYSGLYSEGAENIDVGIIEITDPERYMDLVGAPIHTAVFGGPLEPGQNICKTGATTGYTCGNYEASGRVQIIRTDNANERETHGDIANVCALPGDSGGPVFLEIDGRATIIGVVSGTEAGRADEPCEGMTENIKMMSYSNYEQMWQVINKVVPNAVWKEQRW